MNSSSKENPIFDENSLLGEEKTQDTLSSTKNSLEPRKVNEGIPLSEFDQNSMNNVVENSDRNVTVVNKMNLMKPIKKQQTGSKRISDIIQVNKSVIFFQNGFPGQILEESLEVSNISEVEAEYNVTVISEDEEFDHLDEYVFSMRRTGSYDYNDKYLIAQSPMLKCLYKIAVKIPLIKMEKILKGIIEISSNGIIGKIDIKICSPITLPNLVGDKMLISKDIQFPVLHFFMKSLKRGEFKVTLKNKSKRLLSADLFAVKGETKDILYDAAIQPQTVNYPSGGLATAALLIRVRSAKIESTLKQIRLLIVAKVKGSAAIFSYPCLISLKSPNK